MSTSGDSSDLDEAITHCRAGLKALEAARDGYQSTGAVYPVHLQLAAVELAHAIEVSMKFGLRNQ
jgi:hypothetical protein